MMLLLVVLCGPVQGSDTDPNAAALKKFGESRTYRLSDDVQKGTMTMKTRVEIVKDKKVAIFEDVFEGKLFGTQRVESTTETASLDRFRMMSCKVHIKTPDEDINASLEVKGTKVAATRVSAGNKAEISWDITETTVSEAAAIRLLCAQEQKVGRNIKVDMLCIGKVEIEKDHRFTCLGQEAVYVGNRKFEAFRWQEQWTTKRDPRSTLQEDADWKRTYWVSVDGYLLKRQAIDGVLTLEVK